MQIVLLTSDEGYLSRVFFEELTQQLRGTDIEIKKIFFLNTKARTRIQDKLRKAFFLFSPADLLHSVWSSFMQRVRPLLSSHHLSFETAYKISRISLLEKLKGVAPFDVLVSFNNPVILDAPILSLAPLAVNVHNGRLPEYRGLYTPLWQILNGEKDITVTVHTMTEEIDKGKILMEQALPVKYISFRELLIALRRADAQALKETLMKIKSGDTDGTRRVTTDGKYYGEPSSEELRRVRKKLKGIMNQLPRS